MPKGAWELVLWYMVSMVLCLVFLFVPTLGQRPMGFVMLGVLGVITYIIIRMAVSDQGFGEYVKRTYGKDQTGTDSDHRSTGG
jgi:hypothetical protein